MPSTAALTAIARAGHLSNLEAPAAFTAVVSEFLRDSTLRFRGTMLH